jgi:hypothetical protein
MSHTRDEVLAAMNRAADDVLSAIAAPDEGTRDAVNLVVNAATTYLENPDATLDEAIEENYTLDEDGDGPIEWAQR